MSLPIKLTMPSESDRGAPPDPAMDSRESAGRKSFACNMLRFLLLPLVVLLSAGCSLLPEITMPARPAQPLPQLSKVAVAPFFNLSEEPTVDGRRFALAYFNELQLVQGFEVMPVSQVERAMQDYNIPLNSPRGGPAPGPDPRGRRVGGGGGNRLHALLPAPLRAARGVVRGQSQLPPDPARLRPALGHARGGADSRLRGVRGGDGPGAGADEDADAGLRAVAARGGAADEAAGDAAGPGVAGRAKPARRKAARTTRSSGPRTTRRPLQPRNRPRSTPLAQPARLRGPTPGDSFRRRRARCRRRPCPARPR